VDLWYTALGISFQLQHQNFTMFPFKSFMQNSSTPWYVTNDTIHNDTHIPKVIEEITKFSVKYQEKLENHINFLALTLLDNSQHTYRLSRNTNYFRFVIKKEERKKERK
jgi:hypothetical protein